MLTPLSEKNIEMVQPNLVPSQPNNLLQSFKPFMNSFMVKNKHTQTVMKTNKDF